MDVMNGIPPLLWTASWQAGVMAGAVWLACRQWPRMPANLRVMLWWLVSLKFVVGLVWTQPIPLPVLPASLASADRSFTSVAPVVVAPATNGSADTIGSHDSVGHGRNRSPSLSPSGSASASASSGNTRSSAVSAIVRYGLAVTAGLWMLGVLLQGALLVRQLLRTRQLIARAQPVEGDAVELFDDLVARLDVRVSQPRLRASTDVDTPQVIGLTRPIILLPVGALESFSTRELALTLCHELMHVKRFDLWHGWIPSVAARLFFFHPFARLAAREYSIAREAACDARVLAFMDAPAYDYGRLLMRLGITAREAAPAAAGASPTLHTLKRRLLMLHDASPHARGLSPRWWALAAIAALLVIPMRPTAAQPQQPQQPARQQPQQPAERQQQQQQKQRSADTHQSNHQKPHADQHKQDHDEPWAFIQDENNSVMHGSSMDLAEAKRLRANTSEPLIWFKRDGRAYVIRDRETLENTRALFIPQEKLHEAMRALEDRQTMLGSEQTAMGQQQEAMSEQVRTLHEKVTEAAASMQKSIDEQTRQFEEMKRQIAEEASLGEANIRRMAAEQRRAAEETRVREAEMRRSMVAAQQEALGIRQRMLGEQQAAIGAEQEALSRQLEEMSRSLEWEMRTLFSNALAAGIARPVK